MTALDDKTQIDAIGSTSTLLKVLIKFHTNDFYIPCNLTSYGITGNTNNLVTSFLSNRKRRVSVNGALSDITDVTSGDHRAQFLDLYPSCCTSTTSTETFNRVSASLQMISLYIAKYIQTLIIKFFKQTYSNSRNCQTNGKCSLILHLPITNKTKPSSHRYSLFGHPLSKVTSHAYLGEKLDSKLSLAKHITEITTKLSKVLAMVKRTLGPCKYEVKHTVCCLQYASSTKLEYASSIWNPHTSSEINHLGIIQLSPTP